MAIIDPKNTGKSSAAIAAGVVGAGAAYAAMQGETPAAVPQQMPVADAAGAVPAQQATQISASEPAHIEQLVQSYLGESQAGMPSADALTAADISDMLPEADMLNAIASFPSAEVAQDGGGVGAFFSNVGGALGATGPTAGLLGAAAVVGGVVVGGIALDQVVNC